jgi:hypothetical protein
MKEFVEFCADCPFVPNGVTARVDVIREQNLRDFRGLRITREAPEIIAEIIEDTYRIVSTAVESSNPRIEVGDEASLTVERGGKTQDEVAESIRACDSPRKPKYGRLFGKSVCQAVQIRSF